MLSLLFVENAFFSQVSTRISDLFLTRIVHSESNAPPPEPRAEVVVL